MPRESSPPVAIAANQRIARSVFVLPEPFLPARAVMPRKSDMFTPAQDRNCVISILVNMSWLPAE
jgi:hypothetical protein